MHPVDKLTLLAQEYGETRDVSIYDQMIEIYQSNTKNKYCKMLVFYAATIYQLSPSNNFHIYVHSLVLKYYAELNKIVDEISANA